MNYFQRIKETRVSKNLTQKMLAGMAGIAPGSLSTYENGHKAPPIDAAARIAKSLDVSLDWLFGLEAKESITQTPKTYADLVRLILLIVGASKAFPGIIEKPWREDQRLDEDESLDFLHTEADWGDTKSSYASIEISNWEVVDFFRTWAKLYELHKTDILDDEIYNMWIDKKLLELEQKPLAYSWPISENAGQMDQESNAK